MEFFFFFFFFFFFYTLVNVTIREYAKKNEGDFLV